MIEQIFEMLRNDRYAIDNSDPYDVAYRRGWNSAMDNAARRIRVMVGLAELAACDVDEKGNG